MIEQSFDGQMTEWQRLAGMGWLFMSAEDIKATQEALRELLVRDEQWQGKWMAALDLLDKPISELTAEHARAERLWNVLVMAREALIKYGALTKPGYFIHDYIDALLSAYPSTVAGGGAGQSEGEGR